MIAEIYDEPSDSSFTHDGDEYDLNAVLEATKNMKPKDIDVADMLWVFEYDPMKYQDGKRIFKADLSAPILVSKIKEGKETRIVVLDGDHRLAKAALTGVKTLPSIMVSKDFLKQFKIQPSE